MTSPQQMQRQVLDYVKQGQQAALDAVSAMAETWGVAPGARGGTPEGLGHGPAEFVDQVFDFWVQLLEAQRAIAHSWLAVVAPAGPATGPLVDMSAWSTPATSKTPASATPARSTGLPADEQVSAAASDAVAKAAELTAEKTRS